MQFSTSKFLVFSFKNTYAFDKNLNFSDAVITHVDNFLQRHPELSEEAKLIISNAILARSELERQKKVAKTMIIATQSPPVSSTSSPVPFPAAHPPPTQPQEIQWKQQHEEMLEMER